MSIASEITRIRNNVTATLNAIRAMGGTVPDGATSDDMAAAVRTIPAAAVSYAPYLNDGAITLTNGALSVSRNFVTFNVSSHSVEQYYDITDVTKNSVKNPSTGMMANIASKSTIKTLKAGDHVRILVTVDGVDLSDGYTNAMAITTINAGVTTPTAAVMLFTDDNAVYTSNTYEAETTLTSDYNLGCLIMIVGTNAPQNLSFTATVELWINDEKVVG